MKRGNAFSVRKYPVDIVENNKIIFVKLIMGGNLHKLIKFPIGISLHEIIFFFTHQIFEVFLVVFHQFEDSLLIVLCIVSLRI